MTQKNTGRFSDLGISKNFLAILQQKGFEHPTPIQHQVIPGALTGKDVIGIAQTGTGKTLGFGIPMIQRIGAHGGQGLVLAPTRELALQIQESLDAVGRPLGLRTVVVMGGVSQHVQVKRLRQNPHIVIATPGRLDDLMKQNLYSPKGVTIVTLDEADRMLDIGFLPNIRRIMKAVPQERQTLLFSATMPQSISKLASEFMKMPLRIEVAPEGTTSENIEQEIFVVQKKEKVQLLDFLLNEYAQSKVLIFSRTKHGAKRIARDVRNMGHSATEIHGNRSQVQRQQALDGFKQGRYRVLVATDIAARGIDVKDITLVVNFDLPDGLQDYVHRIGRTGRAQQLGKAISFVTPSEKATVKRIERMINKALLVVSLPKLPEPRVPAPHEKPDNRSNHQRSRTSWQKKKRNPHDQFTSKRNNNRRRKPNTKRHA